METQLIHVNAVKAAGMYARVTTVNCTALSASLSPLIKIGYIMGERDEEYMRLALEEAETAYAKDEVPVGAVLVVSDTVIAKTHNSKEATNDPTAHAELMVIREAAMKMGEWRFEDATLYVTKEPCVMCAGTMLNARLGRLVYGCKDERFGAVNSRYQLLHDPYLNHQVRVVPGILEEECAEILKKFFRKRR